MFGLKFLYENLIMGDYANIQICINLISCLYVTKTGSYRNNDLLKEYQGCTISWEQEFEIWEDINAVPEEEEKYIQQVCLSQERSLAAALTASGLHHSWKYPKTYTTALAI